MSREREELTSPASQNSCMLPFPPRSPSAGGRVLLPRIRRRGETPDSDRLFSSGDEKILPTRPGRLSSAHSFNEPPRESCFSPPSATHRTRMNHSKPDVTAYSVTATLPKRPQSVKSLQALPGNRAGNIVNLHTDWN